MRKLLLAGVLAPALFAEISAFDAGNVEIANPYGLTASEKAMLKNKKHLEGLSKEYAGVDFKTTKALERIDGLQSILDDLGAKNHNLEVKLSDFESVIETKDQARISEQAKLKNLIYANTAEINKLKKAISELLDILESIQGSKPSISSSIASNKSTNTQLSPNARLNTAIALFKAQNYSQAAAEFEALAAIRHKPALNNYYLAECAYAQGDYQKAIYHYKTSIDLYKSQKVKPLNEELILDHTAKSLEKIGQVAQAKMFYDALKAKYPKYKIN